MSVRRKGSLVAVAIDSDEKMYLIICWFMFMTTVHRTTAPENIILKISSRHLNTASSRMSLLFASDC